MNWNIDIYDHVLKLVPYFLRGKGSAQYWTTGNSLWITPGGQAWATALGSRHKDWIKALMKPLIDLHAQFTQKTEDTLYILGISGQVIYLEHYLNDLFDSALRRIYIEDGTIIIPEFLYNLSDNQPDWHLYNQADNEPPFYLYNQADYSTQAEFIVWVPQDIPLTPYFISRIRAAVDRFKQAGVRYTIKHII